MKKILLILILLLTFTLTGFSADLYGTYDQRIKLTVDETKVDTANLTWFPVTVFFTAAQGEEIFSEFDADSDYMKCAFTKADGVTELYAEMELFDVSENKAIYHVSRDGWVITHDADTDFYYYYDNDAADNTTYIGAINTTAGATVWDGNNKLVSHQVDATTSTTKDSTSNSNDGAKLSANNPIETVTGKVGNAQTYSSDYINHGTSTSLDPASSFTLSCLVRFTATGEAIISTAIIEANRHNFFIYFTASHASAYLFKGSGSGAFLTISNDHLDDGVVYHITVIYDGTTVTMYVNGAIQTTTGTGTMSIASGYGFESGRQYIGLDNYHWAGDIDEIRYSTGIVHTAGWIKATYNSLFDTLLTYGAEETVSTGIIWNGITITKFNGIPITIPLNTQ